MQIKKKEKNSENRVLNQKEAIKYVPGVDTNKLRGESGDEARYSVLNSPRFTVAPIWGAARQLHLRETVVHPW